MEVGERFYKLSWHRDVHSRMLFITVKRWKQPKCWSTNEWINISTQQSISHKNAWSSDTCHIMDEPWKHYGEWKQPGTKGLYCRILLLWKVHNKQILRHRKWIRGCQGLREGRVGSDCLMGMRFLLGWLKCPGILYCRWLHNFVNVLKATELDT